jgi:hypothetical protein
VASASNGSAIRRLNGAGNLRRSGSIRNRLNCGDLTRLVAEIVVHKDELVVRLKSDNTDEASDCPDDRSLSIPWQKPPSKRSRQILLPHNASRSDVRPEQFERRARLVSAIARGTESNGFSVWAEHATSDSVVGLVCASFRQ